MLVAHMELPIGVDVMDIRRPMSGSVTEFFRLMRKQFTPREWADIDAAGVSERDRLHKFFHYWTLKESYIKAVGIGLGMDLQRIEFVSDPNLRIGGPSCSQVHGFMWRRICSRTHTRARARTECVFDSY